MEFKVKWLNSEEFDNLPYKKARTSLGLADKNRGEVYVRETGNMALDTFSVYHEIEHLKGNDHGEHEAPDEKGIYYKDLGTTIGTGVGAVGGSLIGQPMLGASIGGSIGGKFGGGSKQKNGLKGLVGQTAMDQFAPQQSGGPQQPQSPHSVQVGGDSGMGGSVGGGGGSMVDRIRQALYSRTKGNYAGGPQ